MWAVGNRQGQAARITRLSPGGKRTSSRSGRMGRGENPPPQLGQTPFSGPSTQSLQKVHSKVQIRASALSGPRSRSQHSQFGRSSSMAAPALR
jgi:hypothetical protein